jgi:hypothetical protein
VPFCTRLQLNFIFLITKKEKEVIFVEKPWEKPFQSRKELKQALNPMGFGFHISYWLGILFAIVGVIGDAVNITLGLESISWLLLSIAAFLAGIPMLTTWAVAQHLLGMKIEK